MQPLNREMLTRLAKRYVWWKTPDEAVKMPERVVAQVMNIGDYDDVQELAVEVGDDYLRRVLAQAEAGQFDARSWAYWHYRLGLAQPGELPALPERSVGFIERSTVLQDRSDTFTVLVPSAGVVAEGILVSFFGPIGFGRVGEPRITSDGVMQVASLDDLMATKLKVMLQRVEAKDYRDVAAMVRAGVDLAKGLAGARAMYGRTFQPSESLKALVYFEGGDLKTLTDADRRTLIEAAGAVRGLPLVTVISRSLQKPAGR